MTKSLYDPEVENILKFGYVSPLRDKYCIKRNTS